MNRQAVLDISNSLEVVDSESGEFAYIWSKTASKCAGSSTP
ncbi:hypothetical protein [Brevibacillus sp. IT-7CA2]